jgi:phosphatidylserine synthase
MEEPSPIEAPRSVSVVQILFIGMPALASWIALALLTFVSLERTEHQFTEGKREIPIVTRELVDYRYLIAAAILLVCVVGCLGIRNRWAQLFLFVGLPLIAAALVVLAIYLSAQNLIEYLRWTNHGRSPAVWDFYWK